MCVRACACARALGILLIENIINVSAFLVSLANSRNVSKALSNCNQWDTNLDLRNMGVKHEEKEHNEHMSRETPWPNLKGCCVKEEKGH